MEIPTVSADLVKVLHESQRLGFLGDRAIDEVVEHARTFVEAIPADALTAVDLGAGGGIPGFVVAHDRPDLHITLVDRRAKRTDFLSRMVRRLGWSDRVAVVEADVENLIAVSPAAFDVAIARGFGPPKITIEYAARLVCPMGRVVISEPPEGDRWDTLQLAELGLCRIDDRTGHVSIFEFLDR
ncbi:MAG: 16S rRNA (guanine527-N7)-methyltransferase [Candidatus Aldehydirespiratoraceae bacterium]|jgi:16S rRNA (guanine527-N7)-methyltransferase